ncbi:hypothetical protein COV61_04835 [Candidatus Micrarchaeota archaeon CG11_big_fil_rev_8_21_14_0_20_47_5]|nr:MAG: hypothetical protein AUJ17_02850 [Candidatus Micrarchaeota archaeon CG1_02_47_40]PIN82822.1 MAG: hypothetical protein COV61_04835 [Candidatus Micrarchaeota archaeon CG11_big_fil_rev_8_21_14_0_20_47_5]
MRSAIFAIFVIAIAISLSYSAFVLERLTISVSVDEKGVSTVQEKAELLLTTPASTERYKSPLVKHDLATWREITGLTELRHHISGANVEMRGIRVRPQPPWRCNDFEGTCHAAILIDYVVYPLYANGTILPNTGLFFAERFKPRTTRFTLNTKAITVGISESGDLVLDKITNLTISIPQNSQNIYVQPLPQNEGKLTGAQAFFWSNAILPKFEFSYEVEESLESEVLEFFNSAQLSLQGALLGAQGLALIVILIVIVSSYVYLNFVKGKNKER